MAVAAWHYDTPKPNPACREYLWPALGNLITARTWSDRRAFDLGCGNGSTANFLSSHGFTVTGVDISKSGIAQANKFFPHVRAEIGSGYHDLRNVYGTFPLVVSLEVIEHCYLPHKFAQTFLSLIAPGGTGFLSTPYHGYLKHVAIAVTGRAEKHFSPLHDEGHVKFFSQKSLAALLHDAGAKDVMFMRVGRIPFLAKSLIAVVQV